MSFFRLPGPFKVFTWSFWYQEDVFSKQSTKTSSSWYQKDQQQKKVCLCVCVCSAECIAVSDPELNIRCAVCDVYSLTLGFLLTAKSSLFDNE